MMDSNSSLQLVVHPPHNFIWAIFLELAYENTVWDCQKLCYGCINSVCGSSWFSGFLTMLRNFVRMVSSDLLLTIICIVCFVAF